jgi:hypothetical protein
MFIAEMRNTKFTEQVGCVLRFWVQTMAWYQPPV